ncbi:MAG: ATP-dependent metallopeptidase FtsH/Yme1/Tma family protein [Sphaerochaetaceae bacterium]|nr:ATP-dependent metallopeptidase FtsH/Yme1/Tma family protein [Sphaerochaetaceae bacterium]
MRKFRYLAIIVALVTLIALLFLPTIPKGEKVSYIDFISLVDDNKVESVEFVDNRIQFISNGNEYNTANPDSSDLKERLLLKGVEIEGDGASFEESLTMLFDTIFNLIFFGMIFGGAFYFITLPGRKFKLIRKTNTTFKDVAGLEDTKRDMMQLVNILKNPKEFEKKGIRQPSGVLFVGNPGNGKTLMAKALAGEAKMNFIATKATDFQSSFMAVGPAKVKALFNRARKNAPCIVFIDEFDGIGEKRNYAGQAIDKENNRIITSLLNEMDGFAGHSTGVMVIGATNNIQDLDPALIRPGRFDRKYLIPQPDKTAREALINLYSKGRTLDDSITLNRLVSMTNGLSAAAIESIMNEAIIISNENARNTISLGDIKKAAERCALPLS